MRVHQRHADAIDIVARVRSTNTIEEDIDDVRVYVLVERCVLFESKKSTVGVVRDAREVASAGTIALRGSRREPRVVDDAFVRRRFRRVVRWRGSLFRSLGGRRARPATARLDDGAGVAKRTALGLGP